MAGWLDCLQLLLKAINTTGHKNLTSPIVVTSGIR